MCRQNHYLETRHNARVTIRTLRSALTWLAASLVVVAFIPSCEAPPKPGNILVVQLGNAEMGGDGKLFRVDPANGARSILSDFANTAQGPEGVDPFGVEVEPTGYILVTDSNLGTESKGKLFRVDPKSGARTVLSDFANTAQGAVGARPFGVAVEPSGHIVVTDPSSGKDSNGALFRVDAKSSVRTLLSDFGNPAQGVLGAAPFGLAVEPYGPILVMDSNAGTDSKGALFRIDATSGTRTVLSDFGNPAQGPEGVVRDIPLPFIDVAVEPSGDILVTAIDTGTDKKGALFRVDAKSGARRILSDFGDSGQGPLGQNPIGVTVVIERK